MTRPTLEDAIALASAVHRGALDKNGQPYILHPLRVMLRLADANERLAAVLHDVIEDSRGTAQELTLAGLRQRGYPEQILAALDGLTHRPGESYMDYVQRLATNPLARAVKRADLADNLDPRRRARPLSPADRARLAKYRRAWRYLVHGRAGAPTVLFICTANYYRSRFAELLFNHWAEQADLAWRAQSRGVALELGAGHRGPIAAQVLRALPEWGVPLPEPVREPLSLTAEDLLAADELIALDETEHRRLLAPRFPDWVEWVRYWQIGDWPQVPDRAALSELAVAVRQLVGSLTG